MGKRERERDREREHLSKNQKKGRERERADDKFLGGPGHGERGECFGSRLRYLYIWECLIIFACKSCADSDIFKEKGSIYCKVNFLYILDEIICYEH